MKENAILLSGIYRKLIPDWVPLRSLQRQINSSPWQGSPRWMVLIGCWAHCGFKIPFRP